MADWRSYGIPLIVIACMRTSGNLFRRQGAAFKAASQRSTSTLQVKKTKKSPFVKYSPPFVLVGLAFLLRKFIRGPMYKGEERMDGKTVVITGANTGVGLETTRDLVRRGAKVVILCRNLNKAKDAANEIKRDTGVDISYYELDLSSLESVRKCAALVKESEPKIHVLINNAAIMGCPQWETKDGLEMQIGTNHFGHFLLTLLLLDNIKAAAPSRIVNLSSINHFGATMNFDDINNRKNYCPSVVYSQSKLANVLFTKSLAKKFKDDGVTSYAVHPGWVKTELVRHMSSTYGSVFNSILRQSSRFFAKTPVLGAQTSIYCAISEEAGQETGRYYNDCKEQIPSGNARNEEDADRLWNMSLEVVNLDKLRGDTMHDEILKCN